MKLTEYLKDKVLLLLLHMVCMAGLVIFLRLTGYSMDKCVIILVCYWQDGFSFSFFHAEAISEN